MKRSRAKGGGAYVKLQVKASTIVKLLGEMPSWFCPEFLLVA